MDALPGAHGHSLADLLLLFGHFITLSLLSIGGAISTVPEMHRLLVKDQGWLGEADFNASIALAQAAPGPNVLFVAVLGWNTAGALGVFACLCGILLPSTTLAFAVTRYGHRRRETIGVRAFTHGMAPLTIGLLLATGWVLTEPARHSVGATLLTLATVAVAWRTRLSPIWLVAAGALVGALGGV
jgi:chromate transporter